MKENSRAAGGAAPGSEDPAAGAAEGAVRRDSGIKIGSRASPVEILITGPDNITPIVLIIFIIVAGVSIAVLEFAGVMESLINFLVIRFAKRKYLLISILIFFGYAGHGSCRQPY
jgi:uncharacterized ion transporter superfamily protein YfcC